MNIAKSLTIVLLSSLINVNANTVGWKEAALVAGALHMVRNQMNSMAIKGEGSMLRRYITKCADALTKGAKIVACQMGVNTLTKSCATCTKADMAMDICMNSCMLYAASNMDAKSMPMVGGVMAEVMEDDATQMAAVLACKPLVSNMMTSVMNRMKSANPVAK